MTVLELVVYLVIAAICGAIARAVAGGTGGGFIISLLVGFLTPLPVYVSPLGRVSTMRTVPAVDEPVLL